MKKLLIISLSLVINLSFAQQITFQNHFNNGSPYDCHGYGAIQLCDSSFIVIGQLIFNSTDGLFAAHITDSGNVDWIKSYYGAGYHSNIIIVDSNFTMSNYFNGLFLTKCNSNGDTLWRQTFGSNSTWEANDIKLTNDKGYIISTIHYGIIKTDSMGVPQWMKPGLSDNLSAIQLADSNYIVAGTFDYSDYQVLKFNSVGDTVWLRSYGYNNDPSEGILASNVLQLPNSNLMVLCTRSGFNSLLDTSWNLMQLDYATGDTIATYNYAHAVFSGQLEDLSYTYDSNIVCNMAGTITKLDTAGNLLWYVAIPDMYLTQVIPTYDGGYFGVGIYWDGNASSKRQIGYVKTDSIGNVTTFVPDIFAAASEAYLYPNPLTTSATLTFKNPQHQKVTVTVYDVLGNAVLLKETSGDNFLIERSGMKSGVYFYEIRENEKMLRGKFVIE